MNRTQLVSVTVLLVVLATGAAPQSVKVQGYLSDKASGSPEPADGTYSMTFELYDSATAGQLVASSGTMTVEIVNGVYDVELPFSTLDYEQAERYLAITVNSEPLSPRLRFVSTPYAYRTEWSANSEHADMAAAVQPGAIVPESLALGAVSLQSLGIVCAAGEVLLSSGGGWSCSSPPPAAFCSTGDFLYCYTGPPGTVDVGSCRAGVRECVPAGNGFGSCSDISPLAEVCDGADNDCDGEIDNGVCLLPSQPVVAVTPNWAYTTSDLLCEIVTPSTDPDGDPLTYLYAWRKDGVLRPELTSATVLSAETARDQAWECEVTPTDGVDNGPPGTDEVTVQNSPPGGPSYCDLAEVSGHLELFHGDCPDADGDAINYSRIWFRNGDLAIDYINQTIVPASELVLGDVWSVDVSCSDDVSPGGNCSAVFAIENNLPTQPMIAITPDPARTADDLYCGVATPSIDPDGDPVSYSYAWTKDGVLRPEFTTETVSSVATAKSQGWECAVTPTDGVDDGAPGFSGTVTISNSPPVGPFSCEIAPGSPTTADDLTVVIGASADPDGDTINHSTNWFRDGTPVPAYQNALTVPASETSAGETWTVSVTADDGTDAGAPVNDSVVISP